jgi:hypothetical protein
LDSTDPESPIRNPQSGNPNPESQSGFPNPIEISVND